MTVATLAVATVLMYAVKATGTLRVSAAGELEGLDLHEHGMVAYPEYVIHGYEPRVELVPKAGREGMSRVPQTEPGMQNEPAIGEAVPCPNVGRSGSSVFRRRQPGPWGRATARGWAGVRSNGHAIPVLCILASAGRSQLCPNPR